MSSATAAKATPPPARRFWRADRAAPYIFLAPNLLLLAAFVLYPILNVFWLSLHDWGILGNPSWVGTRNYVELFAEDEIFLASIKNTLLYTLGTVPLGAVVSLGLAILLNQRIRGVGFFRSLFYFPTMVSMVAVGMIWKYIFSSEYGILNHFLQLLGMAPRGWLVDSHLAMLSLVIATVWRQLGYNMVIFLAGLQGIPETYYEAARIDGANRLDVFRRITLPLLTPTTLFVLVISVINSFRSFELIYTLTGGGPGYDTSVLVMYLYQQGFKLFSMGKASAIAAVLFLMLGLLTGVQFKYFGRKVEY